MNDGDVKTETFKVQVEIEGGKIVEKDITITIKGTNDAPTFTDTVTGLEGLNTCSVGSYSYTSLTYSPYGGCTSHSGDRTS